MSEDTNLNKNQNDNYVGDAGYSPSSPEGLPNIEKSTVPEKEKSPEVPDTPQAPVPRARKEEIIDLSKVDKSDSEGRVVDTRSRKNNTIHLDARDELTQYGDEEEDDFIEGVKTAHESDES